MSGWTKFGSNTARRSARIRSTPKIKSDTTSDNEENDDAKCFNIPGDFNNHTTRFINSVIHEQKPKTKQPKNEIHHRPVCPEITSSTPGAWREEASSSSEEEEAAKEAVKEEEVAEVAEDPEEAEEVQEAEEAEEAEDTVEVSGALARRPSLESVQYPCLEARTSRKPSTTPKSDTHPTRTTAAYASNKPTKAYPTPPIVTVEYDYQSVEIEDIIMEEAPPITSRELLQPNYSYFNSSSGYESDSDSDSGQASVFSRDISYDTPDESDSDMSPSKELATKPPQSHVQSKPDQASANGDLEEPIGKVVAAASWGGGMRVIVSVGPEKARKYIILSHTEGKREYEYDLSTLPRVNTKKYSRSEKEKVTRVCGVALSGAGPEVLNVGKGERNPYIYVSFQWDDGRETWENGAPARELIANMKKKKPVMTDLTPQMYLYFEAKEAWRLADELSKRDQPQHSDDE